jgi:menaquinone-specific isochorismate synthase
VRSVEGRLVARTRVVDGPSDALSALQPGGFAWWHSGGGFVANGVASLLDPSEVSTALSDVEVHDDVGLAATGAIAVGSLGFDPGDPSMMVVPATVLGVAEDGTRWKTEVHPACRPVGSRLVRSRPRRFEIREGMSRARWSSAVRDVLSRIAEGELAKVVLARDLTVTADQDFEVRRVVDGLRQSQGDCYVFASRGLVGASPELLVSRCGEIVRSLPMAGTARTVGGHEQEWLDGSDKNQLEHRLVVETLVARLAPFCVGSPAVSPPRVRTFTDVAHLATSVKGRLTPPRPSALELAIALHPTPAVAGTPTELALRAIAGLEPRRRGRYGGPVGWVDAEGNGEMAVAIRCAEVTGNRAVLHAGAGIVEQSNPDDEWQETEAKLEPMLRVLTGGWPLTSASRRS